MKPSAPFSAPGNPAKGRPSPTSGPPLLRWPQRFTIGYIPTTRRPLQSAGRSGGGYHWPHGMRRFHSDLIRVKRGGLIVVSACRSIYRVVAFGLTFTSGQVQRLVSLVSREMKLQ